MIANGFFPSVLCKPDYVATHDEVTIDCGDRMPLPEHCGFTLLFGQLVPETLVQRVIQELGNSHFEYGYVLGEDDLFSQAFLHSLVSPERDVLMHIVLLLISRSDFPLNLWATPYWQKGDVQ